MPRPATGQVLEKRTANGVTYALRFRAYGQRQYVTLGASSEGWSRSTAEEELANVLADVRRGIWKPPSRTQVHQQPVDPDFHSFASEWFAAKQAQIATNTARSYRNDLTHHLLPYFAQHRLSEITIRSVDDYRASKVREGHLGARSINMTLALLAQILEVAVEYGHLERNPASGRRRRLKAARPRPVHLDTAEHLAVVLEAASALDRARGAQTSGRRAAVAVLLFAGLRAEEVTGLLWRDVDLANGRLYVGRAKTEAGVREVELLPILRDELATYKASRSTHGLDEPVFVTSSGKRRDRHNLRQRVVAPVVRKADELLAERESAPLPGGLSPHKLRHSYASLLVALGNDPAHVMGQLGHTDPAFTLRVYTHMMRRDPGERDRLRALVEGREWAVMGSSGAGGTAKRSAADLAQNAETPAEAGVPMNRGAEI